MPIRNPFTRRPGQPATLDNDENLRPDSNDAQTHLAPSLERLDTVGSKASSAMSIRSAKSQDNGEYKMSVVNDSGVYLPPSPPDKEPAWHRRYLSRNSTDTRSSMGDIEPFSISRESFDSYRRSFDISAKTPVSPHDAPRQSLDSARFPRRPLRTSILDRRVDREPPTAEERFEDVGLGDDQRAQPKKKGFFSKFGSEHPDNSGNPSAPMSRFLPGRKRGQSGQGAELSPMERSETTSRTEQETQ